MNSATKAAFARWLKAMPSVADEPTPIKLTIAIKPADWVKLAQLADRNRRTLEQCIAERLTGGAQ